MKARYLLAMALVLIVASATQMIAHQRHAHQLQVAVLAADEAGQDTAPPLATAQAYVHKHMGTNLNLLLQASYNRAASAAQAAANPPSSGEVYAAAQAACAGKADSVVQARCVQSYVASHATAAPNPQAVAMPNKTDYTKKLSSPVWTPDGVGLTTLLALLSLGGGVYLARHHRI